MYPRLILTLINLTVNPDHFLSVVSLLIALLFINFRNGCVMGDWRGGGGTHVSKIYK